MKLVGKILKYAFILLIVGVFALFFVRCAMMGFPARSSALFPSQAMKDAYAAGSLTVLTQEEADGKITSDGRFTTDSMRYIPETGELIITLRFNNSTLKALGEEYGLDQIYAENEYFEYSLLSSDGTRYYPDATDTFRRAMYNYRRLRFSDITTEGVDSLALCMYYTGDADYTKEAFGTAFAYYAGWETTPYKLTAADIRTLSE